jgi:Ca2+-binding EF-hand superfamily protein
MEQRELDETRLQRAFAQLDRSRTGFISVADVRAAIGISVTEESIVAAIAEHDLVKDGQLSFEEFKLLVMGPQRL